ncbi:MAG: tRNA threonylcarbamoyladenosine dehydratase [Spirochaetes bacterium]|nr:tRNA threonylcarbamoyladenosine dehydratase [Spirochaetota bacterium]
MIQNTDKRFSRTELLIGKANLQKLISCKVLIAGLGGVGSYAFEAIVRAGIGTVHIIDFDVIEISNCNRQLLAMDSTLGMPKVDVAVNRAKDINPGIVVFPHRVRLTPDNITAVIEHTVDFVIDAIDDVAAKTSLIEYLYTHKIPFVSCMGAARAFNPESIRISDISKSQYCPLARVVRRRLKEKGITHGVPCVYFHEERNRTMGVSGNDTVPGSLSFMPGIMGLAAAGCAIKYLLQKD